MKSPYWYIQYHCAPNTFNVKAGFDIKSIMYKNLIEGIAIIIKIIKGKTVQTSSNGCLARRLVKLNFEVHFFTIKTVITPIIQIRMVIV